MSSPFRAPLRLVAKAPRALYVLPVTAVAAAVLTTTTGSAEHPAAPAAVTAANITPEAATAGSGGTSQRPPVLSRDAERTDSAPRHRSTHAAAPSPHQHRKKQQSQPRHRKGRMAPSNAARTVASAKHSRINPPGRCLQWSREQADIPSKYGDAATAWRHASGRRPHGSNPPRGAAVYWTGGSHGYGHIAISLGHHKVRSSDAGGTGRVATVSISHLSRLWHLRYAGWANSINGYRIPGVPS